MPERLDEVCVHLLAGGIAFTKRQSGMGEGAFIVLRAVLVELLLPMREAWRVGRLFSRKSEQLAGREG